MISRAGCKGHMTYSYFCLFHFFKIIQYFTDFSIHPNALTSKRSHDWIHLFLASQRCLILTSHRQLLSLAVLCAMSVYQLCFILILVKWINISDCPFVFQFGSPYSENKLQAHFGSWFWSDSGYRVTVVWTSFLFNYFKLTVATDQIPNFTLYLKQSLTTAHHFFAARMSNDWAILTKEQRFTKYIFGLTGL